ncbi:MAG: hypothetical protein LKE40_04735 [Spirochaetia bacterium]|jgi:hypothetical protein|nr:hypothetical protein [Spirochaetia bacterium]
MARKRTRKYQVRLTDDQVTTIGKMLKGRKVSNTIIARGRQLLLLDENHGERYSHEQVADSAGVCLATVTNVSRLYAEEGFAGVFSTSGLTDLQGFRLMISRRSASSNMTERIERILFADFGARPCRSRRARSHRSTSITLIRHSCICPKAGMMYRSSSFLFVSQYCWLRTQP